MMTQHGTFMWNELMTNDPEKAKAFFGEILGWTYSDMNAEDPQKPVAEGDRTYTICMAGETMAGGMMKMEGPEFQGIPPHWSSYLGVDDVDAAVAKVAPAGGMVAKAAFDIPTVGRMAVIVDPTGAVVCLMTPAQHDCD